MPNSSAKKKILVVEDEAEYRTLLREVLGKAGYAVFDASTGEAGLSLYREQGPDLLLLDVMLPDMTGFDFCTKVRAGKVRPNTPILFCTVAPRCPRLGIEAGTDTSQAVRSNLLGVSASP